MPRLKSIIFLKFKGLQRNGCINRPKGIPRTVINVQAWHWAALPRNSDWPWLLN